MSNPINIILSIYCSIKNASLRLDRLKKLLLLVMLEMYTPLRSMVYQRDDNCRVAIEVAFIENTPLPMPNENIGALLVVHVIGSFVAWPKSLVLFDDMMIIKLSSSLFCLMPIHFIDTLILL